MSDNQTKKVEAQLDEAIANVFKEMESMTADSPEFAAMVEQLDKLYKMRTYEKPSKVDWTAAMAVVGNLVGIASILGFERTGVITSKALGFVLKSRV